MKGRKPAPARFAVRPAPARFNEAGPVKGRKLVDAAELLGAAPCFNEAGPVKGRKPAAVRTPLDELSALQ